MPTNPPKPFYYEPPLEPYVTILHKDDDILVLSKPSGLLSVPGKSDEHKDCLEARVREIHSTATIVHRLDKDTSGVMVMAMNGKAHRHLGLQFEKRQTRKKYIARVWGEVGEDYGSVELPLICDWPNRPKQIVDHVNGRQAVTDWQVLERSNNTSRLLLSPETGRSHQLRVHMLSLGHPILGDSLYAHEKAFAAADRLQLHAEELTIFHPRDGKVCKYTDPSPL